MDVVSMSICYNYQQQQQFRNAFIMELSRLPLTHLGVNTTNLYLIV